MPSIFDKINKIKLETQNKVLSFTLKDSLNVDYQNAFNKKHFGKGCSLDINAKAEEQIEKVKEKAFEIVNLYNKSTLAILDYISSRGYKVVRLSNAKKLLSFVEETPGFICEASGFKALYLNLISGSGFGFKSEPMFIIETTIQEITDFLHDFYLWLAMDMGLPGFDYKTHKLFIRYFVKGEDKLLKQIQIKQMLMLRQAVSRDKEAIEFVIAFDKLNRASKKVHKDSAAEQIFI